jgi:methionine-rich copper-binding protein CopC
VQLRRPGAGVARAGLTGTLTVPRPLYVGAWAGAAFALVGVAFLASGPHRDAPAAIASTAPADGAVVAEAPREVDLSFTGAVNPDLSHVDVRDASGAAVTTGRPRLVRPEVLRQPVDIAAAGGVTVTYHVTLVDGGQLVGTVRFTVGPAGAAATPGPPPPGSPHPHGIDPVGATLLALDGLVALVVVVLLARRPRPTAPAADGARARRRRAGRAGAVRRVARGCGGAGRPGRPR